MDITDTLAPSSDQLDAIDLVGGPRTFTIDSVNRNTSPEQPLNVVLRNFPRVWRPGKSMRRVLAAAWGTDASTYAGRSVTLYCDESIMFGKDKVGGTRISHMSHLERAKTITLPVSRGKVQQFTVKPLVVEAAAPEVDLSTVTDLDALAGMWKKANPERRKQIEARVAELKAARDPEPEPEPDVQQPETDEFDPWAQEADK